MPLFSSPALIMAIALWQTRRPIRAPGFSQLLPIKVYLASVAVALLTENGLEGTGQTLIITQYAEFSFLRGHTVLLRPM